MGRNQEDVLPNLIDWSTTELDSRRSTTKNKIQIVKDGAIQGWFVSACFTLVTVLMLILGLLIDLIAQGWIKIGGTYATIYLGSLTVWLGYKVLKPVIPAVSDVVGKFFTRKNEEVHDTQ